ncbi:cryptochrome/photolyase family protein [Chitinispirillales bacterium ANBcel5]|uniref:cryptochrome/photolyase family protein n=1 Tax=Cellulosispirillum alkaliphilum TaxID=3039283 RepID=UPI002A508971|nr:cryptochrome/photolyase family protein [Chitinispirillales bacterium ANBcel5]
MNEAVVIFPNQLFENHPCLKKNRKVVLVEDSCFFRDFHFHKKKLTFHRAAMKAYQHFLFQKGYTVRYVEFNRSWQRQIAKHKVFAIDPYDPQLKSKLPATAELCNSPGYFGGTLKKSSHYNMAGFYRNQRLQHNILIDDNGKPIGGKWSFDKENRKKLPPHYTPPPVTCYSNSFTDEAVEYVDKHFSQNPGDTSGFFYPVTFKDARHWLKEFIEKRLPYFGDYEDAISTDKEFLYHSLLSPLLNSGLLTPNEVVQSVLATAVPLNSKEGFIRQIVGWREYMFQVYLLEGERQRNSNFFVNTSPLPQSFYTAQTGIVPVDTVISKVLKNAYCHHIERLMVLGNFMMLSNIHPKEIYRWFMEMFIDAYDWVMVPNVFGMSQYADGGLLSTKPYISSSNYILTMSDFKKGEWSLTWDSLYWNFLKKHQHKLQNIPRMKLVLKQLEKKK